MVKGKVDRVKKRGENAPKKQVLGPLIRFSVVWQEQVTEAKDGQCDPKA